MAEQETPTTAFILSLIAGIIIFLSGVMLLVMGASFRNTVMGGYYYPGMMGGYAGMTGFVASMIAWIGIWGIICGAIILYGASQLNSDPGSHGMWGIIIIIISVVSLFEGGGFLIGAILGVVGGIFATAWKPPGITTEGKK